MMQRPPNPAHTAHQLGQPRGLAADVAPERRAATAAWQTVIGVDLSYSGKGDKAAVVVVSRRADEPAERARYYVRDVWSGAKEIRSLRSTLAAWSAKYDGAPMTSYVGASELGVLQLLGEASTDAHGDKQPAVNIVPMLAHSGKAVRSAWTQDLWNAGRIILPRGAVWAEGLARRVLAFTGIDGDQDDEVDALVSAVEFLRVCGGPATSKMSARRTRF
jgi:hypothetical protein